MTAGLAQAAFILLVAVAYALVAKRLAMRETTSREAAQALGAFRLWWGGVATLFFASGVSVGARALGARSIAIDLVLAALGMIAVCAAVGGLVHYVLYIFTGTRRFLRSIAIYYGAIAVVMLVSLARDTAEAARFLDSASELTIVTGPLLSAAIVAFLIPAIAACAAYASLFAKVHEREQKLRVGLTSIAFIAWFGTAVVARLTGIADRDTWPFVGEGIGAIASALVVLAYWPPRAWRSS